MIVARRFGNPLDMTDEQTHDKPQRSQERPDDSELMKAKPGHKPLRPETMEPRPKKKD
jgi:hypothetical protein